MKKSLFTITLTFCCVTVHCQVKEFFDFQESRIDSVSSLYYAIGHKKKVTRNNFKYESFVDSVKTYYTSSGALRSREYYGEDGLRKGPYIQYHMNGSKKEVGFFRDDYRNGSLSGWYDDGKKRFDLEFYDGQPQYVFHYAKFKIINYWNPDGQQILANGNGYCACKFFTDILETGKVSDGMKDSVWTGYDQTTLIYKEKYDHGALIEGESYTSEGLYTYKNFAEEPVYKDGLDGMVKFIRRNMVYPTKARRKGQSGTVYVSFVVGKTGTVEDVKLIRGVSPEIDQEAMRVVKLMNGKWTAGKERGRPVYVRYTLPIMFKLR